MRKSWQLDRRTVLKNAGVALTLPWLEGNLSAASVPAPPKRLCCILFPYGVALPKDGAPDRKWGWFPEGSGEEYQLTEVLRPLSELMDDVSIFGGLSHPNCRSMNGHDTGDTFLTGSKLETSTYRNTISLDQFVAERLGQNTRMASLTLSSDGGIGPRTRSTTLSYTAKGQPIPALSNPKMIFERLFGRDHASQNSQRQLQNAASILDLVNEQARDLRQKLGTADRRKLDEFETSVREVEQRVDRSQRWLSTPLPAVDPEQVLLDANPEGPRDYIRAIYDLMFLAFQTDVTRVATYQIGSYGPTIARAFPACIGLPGNWHGLAHGANKKDGAEKLGRFDQFLTQNLADFLQRLKSTAEGESNMLERTLVLYGSSNSKTHQNNNYPLLLAGGGALGLKHNHYLRFGQETPMANLFVSMLQALGLEADRFADSTGPLAGI